MKAIQEERMKGYFLAAVKELIRGEGLEVVSTRNVAERAGYSYATLYNYFKDIRDLIFSCVEDFMAECREFVAKDVPGAASGEKALIAISNSYVKFFVQYPGIFKLLFQEKADQISTAKTNLVTIGAFFDSLVKPAWGAIVEQRKRTLKEAFQAQECHKLALHGVLMFFLNNRSNYDYKALKNKVDEVTRFAIESL